MIVELALTKVRLPGVLGPLFLLCMLGSTAPGRADCVATVTEHVVSDEATWTYAGADQVSLTQEGQTLQASLRYQIYNVVNPGGEIDQLFLAADWKVLETIYNGHPGACPGVVATWSNPSVDLNTLSPGTYTLYAVRTATTSEQAGRAHYENEHSGWRVAIGSVTIPPCHEFAWSAGSEGTGDGQFGSDLSPRGMVVVGDLLYVCDYGNNRIQWFRLSDGAYVGHKDLGTYPTDIIHDAVRHHFYVRTSCCVIAYDESFNELCTVTIPTQASVHYGLCQDSQGNIHTPSAYYDYVYVVSPDCPIQIARQYPTPNSESVAAGIEAGAGYIYVAHGILGIRKYTESGTYVGIAVPGSEQPAFLCNLPAGRMAVCLAGTQEVAIYDANWVEVCRFGGAGSGDGQFIGQQGIAADAHGNIYVSDHRLHRVQKFTAPVFTGDLNCDGALDNFDINPFVLALTVPSEYARLYPDCDWTLADCNGDGFVDNFDINWFVDLLTAG